MAVFRVRPTGYKYPIGLTQLFSANLATNTTGGDQTMDGDNAVHSFTSSDFFEPSFTGDVEVLVIAGGGGGGGSPSYAGGGGAGGLVYNSAYPVVASSNLSVEIGAGGIRPGMPTPGQGGNSSITYTGVTPYTNVVAVGGGGGGNAYPGPDDPLKGGQPGGSGGGGGSIAPTYAPFGHTPGTLTPGTSIQANNGGTGYGFAGGTGAASPVGPSVTVVGAGGGGAGSVGSNASFPTSTAGNGGLGLDFSISGSSVGYAGGGGGQTSRTDGASPPTIFFGIGGKGPGPNSPTTSQYGGGNGAKSLGPAYPPFVAAENGGVNRGGGAGAGNPTSGGGATSGGSGVVIIRYQSSTPLGYSIN